MSSGVQIRDMGSEVSASLIKLIYRKLLKPTFGPDELDTLATVLDGLVKGSYEAWGLCALDGETPVGCVLGYPYALGDPYGDSRVLLIGYLAVKRGLRGGGIGRELMGAARQRWYGEPNIDLVVAEIEDPRRYRAGNDIYPEKRVKFYAAGGAQIVVGPYFQPKLEGKGKKRVYGLFLSVLHASSQVISPENSLPAGLLAKFLLQYFRDSGGEASDWPQPTDKEGNRLLDWYRCRPEAVHLHPLGEYAQVEIPWVADNP
jgi:hypothetical protein